MNFFDWCETIVTETIQGTIDMIFVRKNKVPWKLNIKHDKNNKIIVGQWTISENISLQVYIAIIEIRTILVSHSRNIDCRTAISNNILWIVLHLMTSPLRGPLL